MKKLLLLLFLPVLVFARHNAHGFCEQGAQVAVTAGIPSSTTEQGSFPSCTVTVFLTGTSTLATLFSDNMGTSLSNPFTANSSGFWLWYADNNRYDVQLSGGGLPAPWKITDILLFDPTSGTPAVTSVSAGPGISVTGPTTTPTVNNTGVLTVTPGTGVSNSGTPQNPILNNTGVLSIGGQTGALAAQGNGMKVQLSTGPTTLNDCVKFDANGNTVDNGTTCNPLPAGTQNQYLRIPPNLGNITTFQFNSISAIFVADYNFPAITPGGSLSVGSNTITLPFGPLGVNGSDTNHFLYISAGTGTPEAVLITGGTCVSGALSACTVIVTCAFTHTGAWTVTSSMGGIPEAGIANPGARLFVNAAVTDNGTWTMLANTTLECAPNVTITQNFSGTSMILVPNNGNTIIGCTINGNQPTGASSNALIGVTGTNFSLLFSTVKNASFNAVNLGVAASNALFWGNTFLGSLGTVIAANNSSVGLQFITVEQNSVSSLGCTSLNCGGVSIWNASHVVISGNTFNVGGNQDAAFYWGQFGSVAPSAVSDASITGNTIQVNGNNAFECAAVTGSYFTFSSNTCYANIATRSGFFGFEFNLAQNGTISGTTVFGHATPSMTGLYFESTNNLTVSGGQISGLGTSSRCAFLQETNATFGLQNNLVTGLECIGISSAIAGDLLLETATTGTVTNNAYVKNLVLGNTIAGHVCIQVGNSAGATESLTIIKDNILQGCNTGILENVTTGSMVIENNTMPGTTNFFSFPSGANTAARIVDTNVGTFTAVAGAVTATSLVGTVTSESLTTVAGATYTLTIGISGVNFPFNGTALAWANTFLGTSTQGTPQIVSVTPSAQQLVIVVKNIHATLAFNGTIKIQYQAINN